MKQMFETEVQLLDGRNFWVEFSIEPADNSVGEHGGAVIESITDDEDQKWELTEFLEEHERIDGTKLDIIGRIQAAYEWERAI